MTLPDPLFTTTLYTIKKNGQTKWSTTFYSNTPTHTYRNSQRHTVTLLNSTHFFLLLKCYSINQSCLIILPLNCQYAYNLNIHLPAPISICAKSHPCTQRLCYPGPPVRKKRPRKDPIGSLKILDFQLNYTCGLKTKHGVLINRRGGQLLFESSW